MKKAVVLSSFQAIVRGQFKKSLIYTCLLKTFGIVNFNFCYNIETKPKKQMKKLFIIQICEETRNILLRSFTNQFKNSLFSGQSLVVASVPLCHTYCTILLMGESSCLSVVGL